MTAYPAMLELIEACPVCGSKAFTDYRTTAYIGSEVQDFLFRYYNLGDRFSEDEYRKIFNGQDYILSVCGDCSAYFQRNRPNTTLAGIVYNTWIGSTDHARNALGRYSLNDAQHYLSEALRLVALVQRLNKVTTLPDLQVMDYGMGNGGFALALKSCFVDVSGAEFAEERIEFGKQNGLKMHKVEEPLPKERFHLINTEQVMEHLPNPQDTLQEFVAALVPGGVLKISVPLSRSHEAGDREIEWTVSRYAKRTPTALHPLEHLQYYTRRTHDAIARDLGLKRVHVHALDHIRYGMNWTPKGAIRNFGRAFLHERQRNYVLLQKPQAKK